MDIYKTIMLRCRIEKWYYNWLIHDLCCRLKWFAPNDVAFTKCFHTTSAGYWECRSWIEASERTLYENSIGFDFAFWIASILCFQLNWGDRRKLTETVFRISLVDARESKLSSKAKRFSRKMMNGVRDAVFSWIISCWEFALSQETALSILNRCQSPSKFSKASIRDDFSQLNFHQPNIIHRQISWN